MSFEDRSSDHQRALNTFIDCIASYGCVVDIIESGTLSNIRKIYDNAALLARHREDGMVIYNGKSVLFDIKSEYKGYKNFSVEIDSIWALQLLSRSIDSGVYIIGVDNNSVLFIPVLDINKTTIHFPSRMSNRINEIKQKFPDWEIACHNGNVYSGSGTPYILLPKISMHPISGFTSVFNQGLLK